jgi:hypothetical protein
LSEAGAAPGICDTWSHPRARSRRGRRTWRMITRVPRELGRPCRLHRGCRSETRLTNSRMIHGPVLSRWGRTRDTTMVSPSEGNEAKRAGRQGVAAPHSSAEAGERALPDPVERRGRRVVDRRPEPRRGHRTSARVTARLTNRVRDSESATRRAGCVFEAHVRICGSPRGAILQGDPAGFSSGFIHRTAGGIAGRAPIAPPLSGPAPACRRSPTDLPR